jgi:hypothetical protein
MRIELNAGGLGGAITVAAFAMSYDKMLNEARAVAATFKTVTRMTSQANGGVGNLQTAVDSIEARLKEEQKKIEKIVTAQKKLGEFIVHTVKTDTRVAVMVAINREMFYLVNPWARPSFANFARRAIKIIGSTFTKIWNSITKFFREHYKAVIKVAVTGAAIVVLALACIAAPEIFVPIVAAVAISTLANVVVETVSTALSGGSAGEIFDAAASGAFKGMIGGVFEGVGLVTGQPWLGLLGGSTASLIDGLIEGKNGWDIAKDMITDFAFSALFFGLKVPDAVQEGVEKGVKSAAKKAFEEVTQKTFTEFLKDLGESIGQGFIQKGYETVRDKLDEAYKKTIELVASSSAIKEALNSNVVGVKQNGVWNGYQAMDIDFSHNFKEFIAQKYDLPVLPGGVGKVDAINSGLHNIGNSNVGGTVTGHSHAGEAIQHIAHQLKPDLPHAVFSAGHSIGEVIHSIIHPTPLPVPTPIPPIDIRDIMRPVNINININIIFKPSFFGAVVA